MRRNDQASVGLGCKCVDAMLNLRAVITFLIGAPMRWLYETSPSTFLHLAAGAAALPAVSRIARAQTYPTRPVHLVVGYPQAA
jgi:hypothetical protein